MRPIPEKLSVAGLALGIVVDGGLDRLDQRRATGTRMCGKTASARVYRCRTRQSAPRTEMDPFSGRTRAVAAWPI